MSAPADDYRIAKLELRPGDVLVAKVDDLMTEEMGRLIADQLGGAFPLNKVLVIDRLIDLSVLTREEIESRVAGSGDRSAA